MDIQNILKRVDHTLLKQTALMEDIDQICADAIKYGCASACIPPYFVKAVKQKYFDDLTVCTVIGFPNGYNTTDTKIFETRRAILEGADEIDMVININMLKQKDYDLILREIDLVKEACRDKVLKVIVEACLLTDEEKVKICEIVSASNADFIKTSTGFSTGGASLEDIRLFKKHMSSHKKIKAAGGISSLEDAQAFIDAGADRLGTSRIVSIIKNQQSEGY